MGFILSVLPTILVFGVIIIVHEFGHFIAARKAGVLVEEFAIGIGPKIVGIKRGDTLYTIRILPFGGFCKMLGDEEDNNDSRAFNQKHVGKRIAIITAGVVMNILLAFVIFFGQTLVDGYYDVRVNDVTAGMPAEKAGLKPGDLITSINNHSVKISEDIAFSLFTYAGGEISVGYKRDGKEFLTFLTPEQDASGYYRIGFSRSLHSGILGKSYEGVSRAGLWDTVHVSCYTMVYNVKAVYYGLFQMATLKADMKEMAGPIGIGAMIGDAVTNTAARAKTFWDSVMAVLGTLMPLVGVLSVNLAVLNLLPIPGLDGGRLVFLIIEAIRRRPIDQNKEAIIHLAGFVLLALFAVYVAVNDIMKFM